MHITRSTPDNLKKRRCRAEKSYLLGIEDSYKGNLWKIESFAEKIYPDDSIGLSEAQISEDLETLDSFDLRVKIADLYAITRKIFSKFFRRFFGNSGYQEALSPA
jgi:hypothetical protein